jgi:hypothetical protein
VGFIQAAAEGAYRLTLERIKRGDDHGLYAPRPEVDLQQQKDLREMMADGRKEEHYLQVLQYYRFEWRESHTLPMTDGVRAQESRWENKKLRMAFTPEDLVTGFPGGPAQFDEWIKNEIQRRRMLRARAPKTEARKLFGRR